MKLRTALILVICTNFFFPVKSSNAISNVETSYHQKYSFTHKNNSNSVEYNAVISYEYGFLAVATGAKIDWISNSGKITKSEKFPGEELYCILTINQQIIVAGGKGTILISSNNGTFKKTDSGTDKNINSLALFKDIIIAGTDDGEILIGDKHGMFTKIQLDLKGNIVSVSSRNYDCYGVTDEGEIIHSTDGFNWTIFDFNKVYEGFYKPCYFTKVLATETQVAVIGKQNNGLPVLLFSTRGSVWTERTLNYTDDQGFSLHLENTPNDLFYDFSKDRFILVCNKGKVMIIPSCSHCNKLFEFSTEDIKGISGNEKTFIIVGENDYIKTINIEFF